MKIRSRPQDCTCAIHFVQWSLFQETILKVRSIVGGHFENRAAIFVVGQISDVPIANNVLKGIL